MSNESWSAHGIELAPALRDPSARFHASQASTGIVPLANRRLPKRIIVTKGLGSANNLRRTTRNEILWPVIEPTGTGHGKGSLAMTAFNPRPRETRRKHGRPGARMTSMSGSRDGAVSFSRKRRDSPYRLWCVGDCWTPWCPESRLWKKLRRLWPAMARSQ